MAERNFKDEKDRQIHEVLVCVYEAMKEKGYNPLTQMVGYLLSDDPTYVTCYNQARSKLTAFDRDDVIEHIIKAYFED